MNLPFFIANRTSGARHQGFSGTIHKIAVITLAVGLAASIVAFLIMEGFRQTVTGKVFGFSSHIVVTKMTLSNSAEEQPFNYHIPLYDSLSNYPLVRHVQEYMHKPGLIKADDDVLGILFKGVSNRFDQSAFSSNLLEGRFIDFSDSAFSREVVLSKTIASKIRAKTGDDIILHFFQNPPRFRRLKVVGIYETNLAEYFDSKVIIGDIRLIRQLNEWPDSLAGGLEVFVKDSKNIDAAFEDIGERMDFDLLVDRVTDRYIHVFEWLKLISRQVWILLAIIVIVVCANLISVVLILVMERTQMIGLLKAMGAADRTIQSIFLYQGMRLIARGLLAGNVIGLGLCYLQYQFRWIKLNPHDYYMDFVPIAWDWQMVIALNVMIFLLVTVVLLLPAGIVSRIRPIRAIRFD